MSDETMRVDVTIKVEGDHRNVPGVTVNGPVQHMTVELAPGERRVEQLKGRVAYHLGLNTQHISVRVRGKTGEREQLTSWEQVESALRVAYTPKVGEPAHPMLTVWASCPFHWSAEAREYEWFEKEVRRQWGIVHEVLGEQVSINVMDILSLKNRVEELEKEAQKQQLRQQMEKPYRAIPSNHNHNVTCGHCHMDIVGHRFKCLTCPAFDLCAPCESSGLHFQHPMLRIAAPMLAEQFLAEHGPPKSSARSSFDRLDELADDTFDFSYSPRS